MKEEAMRAKHLYVVLVMAAACGNGCGVTFGAASVNLQIPDAFTNRSLYPAGVAGYNFEDLVGNILLTRKNADPLRIGVILPASYKSATIPITDSNNYYHSRIQKGAEIQGEYLAFAAKFSAEEMAELTLDDLARASIDINEATWDDIAKKMVAWVKSHPKTESDSSRIWIKSVVLSRRVYKGCTKIDANASGQVGSVTGVKAGVYRTDEDATKSVIVAFDAFDVDKLAAESGPPKGIMIMTPPFRESILEGARYKGVVAGTISNQ